ncbi:MAG: Coenzyme F420 hydrogenase/dehydrogenase, beta subunit C-terminal domain, partial [Sphingomonadaceae bacterium]
LRQVMRGGTCAGCGLCAGIDPAIRLARDGKGWWRPEAKGPARPETEALMARACPGVRVSPWAPSEAPVVDPLWGPIVRVMTAHATDPEVRHRASSGGALSALAIHLLESRAVERVLHVGMDEAAPLLTAIRRSAGRADVIRAAGSRYAPAAPLAELEAELAEPGRILFIGKPCDAGALRQLIGARPDLADRFPLILSFFCAGTPSQDGTTRLVGRMGMAPGEVTAFRYRGDGWPGLATATSEDGRTARLSYAESWGEVLSREVQLRCKICPDAVGGVADVAAADAWYGGDSGYPAFDEADGRSLLISRTAAGDALVRAAQAVGVLETAPLDVGEVVKMQPAQARRRRELEARVLALRLAGRPVPRMDGLLLSEAARQAPFPRRLRATLGLIKRLALGRI